MTTISHSNIDLNGSPATPTNNDDNSEVATKLEWITEDGEETNNNFQFCILVRLWTERNIHLRSFIDTMKNSWRPKGDIEGEILDKQRKIFIFRFDNTDDKKRILADQPWHFERHALILNDIRGDEDLLEVPLFFVPYWVRVYKLPIIGRLNGENVKNLGNMIGTFVGVDKSSISSIRRCLRIKVLLDVRKPLINSIILHINGGRETTVMITYEKLPLFCYVCGKFGHGEKDCCDRKGEVGEERRFGDWLRASPWKPLQKEDIKKGDSSCAKVLFADESKKREEDEVTRMAECLRKISFAEKGEPGFLALKCNDKLLKVGKHNADCVRESSASAHSKEEASKEVQTNESSQGSSNEMAGDSVRMSRKIFKAKRTGYKNGGKCVGNQTTTEGRGKRKNIGGDAVMEEELGGCCKKARMVEGETNTFSVAVVGEDQPREKR